MHSQKTFETASADRKNVIYLITDGVATRPTDTPTGQAEALAEKNTVSALGTIIRPLFYNPFATPSDLEYVNDLGSDSALGANQVIFIDPEDTQAAVDEAVFSDGVSSLCNFQVSFEPDGRLDLIVCNFTTTSISICIFTTASHICLTFFIHSQ